MGKKRKRKRKVNLPVDSKGRPIRVGDIVAWGDGTIFKVTSMEYYGKCPKGMSDWILCGCDDDEFSDNPEACVIVGRIGDE